MANVENRESIKRRLQSEAARQWGVDELDLKNGSFDPLVDLLFGAFAVESEKIWQEMESSRSRVVKRMVETVLPEVATGIIPAHSVILAKPASGNAGINPADLFSTSGSDPVSLSPAGTFQLSGAVIQVIASGSRIDKVNHVFEREQLLQTGTIPANTCWLGIALPDGMDTDELVFFFNWTSPAERVRYLPYISSIKYFDGPAKPFPRQNLPYESRGGIHSLETNGSSQRFFENYEKTVRDYYYPHFVTVNGLAANEGLKRYPEEWSGFVSSQQAQSIFSKELLWVRLSCPASIPAEALDRMEVALNCVPVLNRRLIHQRGRLQPLFNVYGLKDEEGFLAIEKVVNGDGEELAPVSQKQLTKGQHVYSIRRQNVARFDQRDAFESLNDITSRMRDDLAAFDAMDNSILSSHLETISRSINKMKEHLETFAYSLPKIYVLVKTRSVGTILDIYFWTSQGSKANGLKALSRLNPESGNKFRTESPLLVLPTVDGRDPMDEFQMQNAFKEAILTRGKAVTVEDFRTITRNLLGPVAIKVEVKKSLSIGEADKEGLRRTLDVKITPDPALIQSEEYWLKQAQLVKNTLEQRSTGVLPLFVSVHGFSWKL